jgi:opacity protein-like surface antigen
MKKMTVLLALGAFLFAGQAEAQIRAGAGLMFGTLTDDLGININGEYAFNDKWSTEAHVSIFFVEDIEGGGFTADQSLWMIDFDAHYHIIKGLYALAGLNFTTFKASTDVLGTQVSASDTDVGLNIGAGYLLDLGGRIKPFGDIRYVISGSDQLVIRAGAKYEFGK